LKCAVFSEEVETSQDVGGWRKLSKEDYQALVERVEESKEEIKKENEELDPDELVPVTFQGAMRPTPPELTATLLPFQVEGVSWMYHQEISGDSGVHGGMLCDEVRSARFEVAGRDYANLPVFLFGDGDGKDYSDDRHHSR